MWEVVAGTTLDEQQLEYDTFRFACATCSTSAHREERMDIYRSSVYDVLDRIN